MKKALVVLLLLGLIFIGCDSVGLGGDDSSSDVDTEAEQQAEEEAEQTVNDVLDTMSNLDFSDPTSSDFTQEMESSINDMDESFDAVLNEDPNNPVGNLGKALTGMAKIGLSSEVQNAIPSDLLNSTTRAFTLDFSSAGSIRELQNRSVSVSNWFDIMENTVLPQIKSSLERLDTAIDNMGDETILITADAAADFNDAGKIEIDKSDLYIPKAVLNLMKGAIEFVLTWDYSMVDENGDPIDLASAYTSGDITSEDQLMNILMLNIDASEESDFLSFYNSDYLADSQTSFLTVVDAVKSFETSVKAETDDQTDDLIPNTDLQIPDSEQTEIENGLANNLGIDAEISSISDIADVIGDIISGDKVITVEAMYVTDPNTGDTSPITLVIDVSSLFALDTSNGLRAFLPDLDMENEEISFPSGYDYSLGGILQKDGGVSLTGDEFAGLIMSAMM